jgi:serine/threonine-protein kinase RsbW
MEGRLEPLSAVSDRHSVEHTMILRVKAELNNLEVIRHFIEENVLALQADQNAMYDLVQAVDECATNIIEHGYRGRPGPIEIEIERRDETITVVLRDQAPAFDPTGVPPPDLTLPLEQRDPGGLGIYLTRRMVDEMRYGVSPAGDNELVLSKHVQRTNS